MVKLHDIVIALLCEFLVTVPHAAHASHTAASIPLGTFRGMQPTLQVLVAGRQETFLFDTGGGVTIISPTLAKAVGCEPWGNVVGLRMTGQRIDLPHCDNVSITLGEVPYRVPTAAVFDIMSMAGKDPPTLDGSVALDVFADKAITIDEAESRLIVETDASLAARTRRAIEVPIRLVREAEGVALSVVVGVPTSKGLAWMELDTGNDDPLIVVSKYIAPLLGVDPAIHSPQQINAVLASGITLKGGAKVVAGLVMDGNIGIRFLKAWNITLDLKHGRAWFAPVKP
jgi:Aspartyl protease